MATVKDFTTLTRLAAIPSGGDLVIVVGGEPQVISTDVLVAEIQAGAAPAPTDQDTYAVWSSSPDTPSEPDFTAGFVSTSGTIAVGNFGAVSAYLSFATVNGGLSDIRQDQSPDNARAQFADVPVTLDIGGTTHYVYTSKTPIRARAVSWVLS